MLPRHPFGKTGHESTRTLFGAAALGSMTQEKADRILDVLLEYGVNHIDVAASYGDAELRVGPWMKKHRKAFFLATKTGERTGEAARESILRSLERLQVDQVDLIQLHNLTEEADWLTATGPGGALEAAIDARDEGLVRFIGVTGHGIHAPAMHLRSLEHFPFDSVLFPLNFPLMKDEAYAADVAALLKICHGRNVAVQAIKSVCRRRWLPSDAQPHYSWYEPVRDPDALVRVVHWLLSHTGVFLNTSSDATLLPSILDAAERFSKAESRQAIEKALQRDVQRLEMTPLFIRGVTDTI